MEKGAEQKEGSTPRPCKWLGELQGSSKYWLPNVKRLPFPTFNLHFEEVDNVTIFHNSLGSPYGFNIYSPWYDDHGISWGTLRGKVMRAKPSWMRLELLKYGTQDIIFPGPLEDMARRWPDHCKLENSSLWAVTFGFNLLDSEERMSGFKDMTWHLLQPMTFVVALL